MRIRRLAMIKGTILLIIASANPASAQGGLGVVHPLFMTAIREPVLPDTAPTARSMAMGGLRGTSGLADEALVSPANLLRSTGADVVISGGPFLFGREEPAASPEFFEGSNGGVVDPGKLQHPAQTPSAVGFAAVAARHSRWAFGAFVDATVNYTQQFDTSSAVVSAFQNRAGFLIATATGKATVSTSATKIGGSLAVAPIPGRLSVGVAIYGTHFEYSAATRLDEIWTGNFVLGPVASTETEDVAFDSWRPGWVASAHIRVRSMWNASVRWQHDPRFTSERSLSRSISPPVPTGVGSLLVRPPQTSPVSIGLPDSLGISTDATFGTTTIGVAVSRVLADGFFQQQEANCRDSFCSDWGWDPDVITRRVFLVHGGLEHRVVIGRCSLLVRGGLSVEQSAALMFSGAPLARTMTWSGGAGYALGRVEIAGAIAAGNGRTRVLFDLRMALP